MNAPRPGPIRFLTLATVIATLSGCGAGDLHALRHWVAGVEARPAAPIAPASAPQRSHPYVWTGKNLRSPFVLAAEPGANGTQAQGGQTQTYLEQFSLDSLRLVGELALGGRTWALVMDPQGRVIRVGVGDRLGRNGGRIVAITPAGIDISEPASDGAVVRAEHVLAFARSPGG